MPIQIDFQVTHINRPYAIMACLPDPDWLTVRMAKNLDRALQGNIELAQDIPNPDHGFQFTYLIDESMAYEFSVTPVDGDDTSDDDDDWTDTDSVDDDDIDGRPLRDMIDDASDIVANIKYDLHWDCQSM